MWSSVVIGTHPIEANQEVALDLSADDSPIGPLPAYWLENKAGNSLWQVPVPPFAVGARLRYRSIARKNGSEVVASTQQEVVVRPNLPDRAESGGEIVSPPEALVGNRMMTAKVDARGSTYDLYFPTVGLHSDVRPAQGDRPESRSHFRAIIGGLGVGRRLDWFSERLSWKSFQRYQGATNLLMTELSWRHGPIRVLVTDFVAMGPDLPKTRGGARSPGQYIKRFRIVNEGPEPLRSMFGVYVQAEVNGGIGEPGLSWLDSDRALLASNRGHGHSNRKLARDSTVEFALALDGRVDSFCEPTGPDEAIVLCWVDIPAGDSASVDLLVSGAFTGWRGDQGTYEHWLKPALSWFRAADRDALELASADAWDAFVEPIPELEFPKPDYSVRLRRSALAAALHADADWGAIASGFRRGLDAYCWPRDALWTAGALDRIGHTEVGRGVFQWLSRVTLQKRTFDYWFQKYSIDGSPEWETPAVDPTATIPWALQRYYRRTGNLDFVRSCWPIVEQAVRVCSGASGHPGLSFVDDLGLISSAGIWDNRYAAFAYSNAAVVAGLRAAIDLARLVDRTESVAAWESLADRIWEVGILSESDPSGLGPGLVDPDSGRFFEARRLSTRPGLWTDRAESRIERSTAVDVSLLGFAVPFGLLPAGDPRVRASADAILRQNAVEGSTGFSCWTADPGRPEASIGPGDAFQHDLSSLSTLWVARYLLRLGQETGDGRQWTRAVAILDALLDHLGPLGLLLRTRPRRDDDPGPRDAATAGVWGLHAMLIEAILDIVGLDYDVPERLLILEPKLPPAWPSMGTSRSFLCGDLSYVLRRSDAGTGLSLAIEARLSTAAQLRVAIACPALSALGAWAADPEATAPAFNAASRQVSWLVELPEGTSRREWFWG